MRTYDNLRPQHGQNSLKEIAKAVFHYDASTVVGRSNDGDLVTNLRDLSGNGFHLSASGSQRPTYVPAAYNGLPVLRFAGGQCLRYAFNAYTQAKFLERYAATDGLTVVAVFNSKGSPLYGSGTIWGLADILEAPDTHQGPYMYTVQTGSVFNPGFVTSSADGTDLYEVDATLYNVGNALSIVTLTYNSTTPTAAMTVNNQVETLVPYTVGAGKGIFTGNDASLTIGSLLTLGGSIQINSPFIGDICEVALFEGVLTGSNIIAANQSLSKKWGVTIA